MSLQLLPSDVLNIILCYLDYKSCLICFGLFKKFYYLNTDKFWLVKIKNEFK